MACHVAPLKTMNSKADLPQRNGIPMPLWLQGAFEATQMFVISALIVAIPLAATWFTGGFAQQDVSVAARLAGHIWLLGHGVPLELTEASGPSSASLETGLVSLLPLGLVLIPFLLSWRSGRRLARASYTDQLWQPLFGALAVYAGAGLATAFVCSSPEVSAPLIASTLIPLIPAGAGLIIGSRLEAGSWGRRIGVNAADWISRTSQDQRWAGSYAVSAVRASFVATMAALALSALLLTITVMARWNDIVGVYQALRPGAVGGAALIVPVAAGVLAGWWFIRAGENHFDEWFSLKVRQRWISLPVSTLFLGAVIGAVTAFLSGILFWISQGSVGIGRLTQVGPDPLSAAMWLGIEVAVGVMIGALAGPWLEGERPSMALPRRPEEHPE